MSYLVKFRNHGLYIPQNIDALNVQGWAFEYAFIDTEGLVCAIFPRSEVHSIVREDVG